MITVASLLDKEANSTTIGYWELLERECNLFEINTVPFPHFSWLTAKGADHNALIEALQLVSKKIKAFSVRTSGLGVFTGESPVLFLPLIKTKQVMSFHELLWNSLKQHVDEINSHYSPDNWLPHITIAYGDVSSPRLACAIEELASHDLSISITIDNIAFLSRLEDEAKVENVINLQT